MKQLHLILVVIETIGYIIIKDRNVIYSIPLQEAIIDLDIEN